MAGRLSAKAEGRPVTIEAKDQSLTIRFTGLGQAWSMRRYRQSLGGPACWFTVMTGVPVYADVPWLPRLRITPGGWLSRLFMRA